MSVTRSFIFGIGWPAVVLICAATCLAGELPALRGPYLGQPPPGKTPVLFAPGVVSTTHEHSAAMFTPDGDEIWFARLEPSAIYRMTREKIGWIGPVVAPFSGRYADLYPCLSYDGDRMVFSSNRPLGIDEQGRSEGIVHLWMVNRNEITWGNPEYLGSDVNIGNRVSCGSIALDGSLFLSVKVGDGDNRSRDIVVSRIVEGWYAAPEPLGGEINSRQPEHSAFISPDGSFLLFSSFRGGYGRSDLFVSFLGEDGAWSRPVNLGENVNSDMKDEYPYLSPDGKYLFFNSNRISALNDAPIPDGPGNIYWVDAAVIEDLRPRPVE
jgi:Tol biopolymer transport system component